MEPAVRPERIVPLWTSEQSLLRARKHPSSACRATAAIRSGFRTFQARNWCCSSIRGPILLVVPAKPSTSRAPVPTAHQVRSRLSLENALETQEDQGNPAAAFSEN